jgi:hypothetical protein
MTTLTKGHDYGFIRAQAKADIDALAAKGRSRIMTHAPGMDYVYRAKLEEAKSLTADNTQSLDDFPFLTSEAQAMGIHPAELAQRIIDAARTLHERLAAIEHQRRKRKMEIDAAVDKPSAIRAVVDAWIGYPQPK